MLVGLVGITQCKRGNWCSHDGKDYLCQGCRADDPTPEQELLAKLSAHLVESANLLDEIEALNYERGMQAAAAMREP